MRCALCANGGFKSLDIFGFERLVAWFDLLAEARTTRTAYEAGRSRVNTLAAQLQARKQVAVGLTVSVGSDERQKAEALARLKELRV